jgi:hypothetical protein
MRCLHPHCPAGRGARSWEELLDSPLLKARKIDKPVLLSTLNKDFGPLSSPAVAKNIPVPNAALIDQLVRTCPSPVQLARSGSHAEAIVHLCEISLGTTITSANVYDAFRVQYPGREKFAYPACVSAISEQTTTARWCCSG